MLHGPRAGRARRCACSAMHSASVRLIVCMDGDAIGRTAATRAARWAHSSCRRVSATTRSLSWPRTKRAPRSIFGTERRSLKWESRTHRLNGNSSARLCGACARRGARATAGYASNRPPWHARASCGKACLGMVASFGGLKHMHPTQVWPVFNDKPWACVVMQHTRTPSSGSLASVLMHD